ncbi:hypothetical protein Tco_0534476 [Tanacetum coccineum]
MNLLSESLTARIKEQVKDQLPQILPQEVSNFTPPVIEKLIKESRDEVTLAKKRKTSKDTEPTTSPKKKDSTSESSKGTKSQPKSTRKYVQSEEPVFEVADSDMPQDQAGNLGDNEDEPMDETASRCDCYQFEFFINNDLKYLQGGISTLTYTTSTTKTKAAQYDLPGIEDMVLNIWSLVKIAYDKYALWGISHRREQRKSFYAFARGMQSREMIIVRRADNILYRFKEGDFPQLRINDIEDMLILVKRVEDLQLRVESYQKKINVTKHDTIKLDLKKRHPYTPYKDPQEFIYVDDYKRNKLMRSDELYKFSDGTLTRLLSSLEDITKNIDMKYLPKRRWSNLEKKRAHFMIKDINKLLKERRMMRSLEKFVGGRLYEN